MSPAGGSVNMLAVNELRAAGAHLFPLSLFAAEHLPQSTQLVFYSSAAFTYFLLFHVNNRANVCLAATNSLSSPSLLDHNPTYYSPWSKSV